MPRSFCVAVEPSDGHLEFIGLRPKMYSLLVGDKEKKTGKGIQKAFLKKNVTHAHYRRCLLSDDRVDQQQLAAFQATDASESLAAGRVGKLSSRRIWPAHTGRPKRKRSIHAVRAKSIVGGFS